MAAVLSIPPLQDLKLTLHHSILIKPASQQSDESDNKFLYLSNIDQILNYNIPTAHFFAANPDYSPQIVAEMSKLALQKLLVTYDFMAGRFQVNHQSGRLEIDCNAAGAGFVVASSEYSLEELGDLVRPSLGFRQLAPQTLDSLGPQQDQPLCIFQVTSFKCGGFALGMSTNHVLLDGLGAQVFMKNLASQAFDDKPLEIIPCNDRHLLAARSPPQIPFDHPEFFKPDLKPTSGPPVFDCNREELDYKVFKFPPAAITSLKEKANSDPGKRISSLTVAASLIWRCKALSSGEDENRVSTLLNVIDIRSKLNPPLPASYAGNAVLIAYARAKCGEIEKGEFSELVEMVGVGPGRVSNEYARSMIDWLEVNKGLPYGEYMVSSWMRLGFDQVAYPWGKPVCSVPVVSHRKDICWVFPDPDGFINALVSLPAVEMERFQSHFHNFFA